MEAKEFQSFAEYREALEAYRSIAWKNKTRDSATFFSSARISHAHASVILQARRIEKNSPTPRTYMHATSSPRRGGPFVYRARERARAREKNRDIGQRPNFIGASAAVSR